MNEAAALFAALLATSEVTALHYAGLCLISQKLLPAAKTLGCRRLPVAVIALVPIHLAGIAVFAGVMYALIATGFGDLSGRDASFGAALYLSGVSYTSLGFGDVVPLGALELVAIVECVTGLLLIGWSASFTYLEMVAVWDADDS